MALQQKKHTSYDFVIKNLLAGGKCWSLISLWYHLPEWSSVWVIYQASSLAVSQFRFGGTFPFPYERSILLLLYGWWCGWTEAKLTMQQSINSFCGVCLAVYGFSCNFVVIQFYSKRVFLFTLQKRQVISSVLGFQWLGQRRHIATRMTYHQLMYSGTPKKLRKW